MVGNTVNDTLILLLCLIAAILHGITGFGFPMMSTAALSTQFSLSTAVSLVILPCLILNIMVLSSDPTRGFVQTLRYYAQRYWPLVMSSIVGSLIGVKLLLWLNEGYLKLLMGVVILFYVLDQLRKTPFNINNNISSMLCFGLLAGIVGGATNAMAPFLMMYLLSAQLSKLEIVIVSNLCFLVSKGMQAVMLMPVLIGFRLNDYYFLMWITLLGLIGVWLGHRIRHHLSPLQRYWYLCLRSCLPCQWPRAMSWFQLPRKPLWQLLQTRLFSYFLGALP